MGTRGTKLKWAGNGREKKNPSPGEGDGFGNKLEPFAKEEAGKLRSHPSSLTAKYGQIKGHRPKNKAKIGGFLRFFVRVLLRGSRQQFDFEWFWWLGGACRAIVFFPRSDGGDAMGGAARVIVISKTGLTLH